MVRNYSNIVTNIVTAFAQLDRRAQFGKVVIVRGTNREKEKIHEGIRRGGMGTREARIRWKEGAPQGGGRNV